MKELLKLLKLKSVMEKLEDIEKDPDIVNLEDIKEFFVIVLGNWLM